MMLFHSISLISDIFSIQKPTSFVLYSSCSSSGSEGSVLSPTDKVSIEPEMLMTCLREGFGITRRIHDRYFNEVKQSIPNRDPGKVG